MNTRKYPRTLNEAFGPYASAHFEESDPMPTSDKIVVVVSLIALVAVAVMAIVGWLPGGGV